MCFFSGGVTTVRHRRGNLGTVEPTPSQERRRIDGVVDGVTRTRGRCFVMASMMLCFDVFSSLSINLSIASKLAMQTSHSFGSALALAASPVASSASASNIRRSIVLGGESLILQQVSWATLSCTSAVTASHSGRKVYARVVLPTTLLHSVKRVNYDYHQNTWSFPVPSVSMNASLQNAARAATAAHAVAERSVRRQDITQ